MKSEIDHRRTRAWSLALTMTTYFALSAFLIVLLATGYLYWMMVRNLDLEDDRLLADRIRLLQAILTHDPIDMTALRNEVDEVRDAGQFTQLFIRIVDPLGHVVCQSNDMDDLLPITSFPMPAEQPGVGSNIHTQSGPLQRVMTVKVTGTVQHSSPWVVQVGMDRREEEEMLREYQTNLISVLVASLVICTLAGYEITRRGIRPLHSITQVVGSTQPTNLSERIDTTGLPTELQKLVDTFNGMMERLDRGFNRLSRFTADIAHELRTPVNNMRGELDVALTKPRSPEQYEEVIGSSLEELGRLSRIIESLLFLARAENPQTQIEREEIDLQKELSNIREFFDATAEDAGISLDVLVEPPLKANLNRALFQQAIGNLITNAISHTPPSGQVKIRASQDGLTVVIDIDDTGCGIAANHLPHVLNRFYRADQSPSDQSPGIGLGLSIVKSIVDLHNGHIEITSEIGTGTHIRLILPLSER